ncbi:hypothetical protein ABBQ32_007605 [Trebouxia sp. C0010 RCD-2024]
MFTCNIRRGRAPADNSEILAMFRLQYSGEGATYTLADDVSILKKGTEVLGWHSLCGVRPSLQTGHHARLMWRMADASIARISSPLQSMREDSRKSPDTYT